MSEEFEEALSKARTYIMQKPGTAFVSSLMMMLKVETSDYVPTAATDGLSIIFNKPWFMGLTKGQRVFLVLHEVWHVAYLHGDRRLSRQPKEWNWACDYVINARLHSEGFEFIPGGKLDMKFDNWTSEDVYDYIINNGDPQGQESGIGEDLVDIGGSDEASGTKRAMVQEAIARAAMQAKLRDQAGSIPDSIARNIEEFRNPRLPWNQILQMYMQERTKEDTNWKRRNRRYSDVYLPSKDSTAMGALRAYFDCSGSVDQHQLNMGASEILGIKQDCNPTALTLRAFACSLGKEQTFAQDEEVSIEADVSGGTQLEPILDDINVHEEETEVAVIFTDGHFFGWPSTPQLDVEIIWVIIGNPNFECPYGFTTIFMED